MDILAVPPCEQCVYFPRARAWGRCGRCRYLSAIATCQCPHRIDWPCGCSDDCPVAVEQRCPAPALALASPTRSSEVKAERSEP